MTDPIKPDPLQDELHASRTGEPHRDGASALDYLKLTIVPGFLSSSEDPLSSLPRAISWDATTYNFTPRRLQIDSLTTSRIGWKTEAQRCRSPFAIN